MKEPLAAWATALTEHIARGTTEVKVLRAPAVNVRQNEAWTFNLDDITSLSKRAHECGDEKLLNQMWLFAAVQLGMLALAAVGIWDRKSCQ